MRVVQQKHNEKHILKLYQEEDSWNNPRENWNIGKMYCAHKRYALGDIQITPESLRQHKTWQDWLEQTLVSQMQNHNYVALPLYLFDHSRLSISTKPFGCPWDSGQIGYIYAALTEEFATKEKMQQRLEYEVTLYNHYLQGDVYGFVIERKDYCDHCRRETLVAIANFGGFIPVDGMFAMLEEMQTEANPYITEVQDLFEALKKDYMKNR